MRITAPRIAPDFTTEHAARIRPELVTVPPCIRCGQVPPAGYSRHDDDTVICLPGTRTCIDTRPER